MHPLTGNEGRSEGKEEEGAMKGCQGVATACFAASVEDSADMRSKPPHQFYYRLGWGWGGRHMGQATTPVLPGRGGGGDQKAHGRLRSIK